MLHARTVSLLTILFSFGLLLLGAMVHYSSNSLVCTSWPLCYGFSQPLGLSLNFSHRILGVIVGALTLLLAFNVKMKEVKSEVGNLSLLGFFALFLVGLQGLLGGVTSLYRLPTIVGTSHFALSLFFVSVLILLDHRLGHQAHKDRLASDSHHFLGLHLSDGLGFLVFLSFTGTLLGAFVRHSGVMDACGVGWDSALVCQEEGFSRWWPRLAPGQIHMFYRYFSFFTSAFGLFWLTRVALYSKIKRAGFKVILAGSFLFLVSYQVFGILAIGYSLERFWTVTHFGAGVLSIGFIWKLNLLVREAEKQSAAMPKTSVWQDLLVLTKPRLGLLVMATVFVGMMLAPRKLFFFQGLFGFFFTFLLVMGAAAYNCWMEREVDGLMDRTKNRPLPSGRMKSQTAFVFSLGLMVFALAGLYFFVNGATSLLGLIAAALYLYAYTPLKQKSVVALYVGAIPGAIPPLMGWTIVMGKMTPLAWAIFAILFVWQLPHFLAISIYYAKDYGRAKIKVYPNSFGLTLTKWGIFVLTGLLAFVSLYPWLYDWGVSDYYGQFAIFLNALFVAVSIKVLTVSNAERDLLDRWARVYFFGSIFYLPLLLGSMIYLS